jgi:hypothetical protein
MRGQAVFSTERVLERPWSHSKLGGFLARTSGAAVFMRVLAMVISEIASS